MATYFRRLPTGWPDDYKLPKDHAESWLIYSVCTELHPPRCTTRADVNALTDQKDALAARTTYQQFTRYAQTGLPLHQLYDTTKYHHALEFKLHEHDTHNTKVWRIWGTGKIRVYFVIVGKRLVVLKTWAKRTDKLTPGQEAELIGIAKDVLLSIESTTFEALEIK